MFEKLTGPRYSAELAMHFRLFLILQTLLLAVARNASFTPHSVTMLARRG